MNNEQPWLDLDGIPRASIYDGREHVAVIEQRRDGWHVAVRGHDVGVCTDRAGALHLVNITLNPPRH
jgi:hypothetical protein